MRRKGSVNRRTGKTLPRLKGKTHWRVKRSTGRPPTAGIPRKSGVSGSAATKKAAP